MDSRNLPPPDRLFWVRDNDSYWTHPQQKWMLDWIQYGKDTHTANVAFGPRDQDATPEAAKPRRAPADPRTIEHRELKLDDSEPAVTPWRLDHGEG